MKLQSAITSNNIELIRQIIAEDANSVHERDESLVTPLHLAVAQKGIDVNIIKTLLSAGADLKAKDSQGRTPLHTACAVWVENDNFRVVKALIKAGADAYNQDNSGTTPFNIATHQERATVLEILIERKAPPAAIVGKDNTDEGQKDEGKGHNEVRAIIPYPNPLGFGAIGWLSSGYNDRIFIYDDATILNRDRDYNILGEEKEGKDGRANIPHNEVGATTRTPSSTLFGYSPGHPVFGHERRLKLLTDILNTLLSEPHDSKPDNSKPDDAPSQTSSSPRNTR